MGFLEVVIIISSIFGIYSATQPAPCPVVVVPENNQVESLQGLHVKEYTLQVECKYLTK